METNLIFKRQIIIDGVTKVVTRIVHVDIPQINSGEGWTLSGHTDTLEVCEGIYCHHVAPPSEEGLKCTEGMQIRIEEPPTITLEDTPVPDKFQSDVKGTAKLVRSKGVIKIVARRGKTTYNQTTPNSVCINDFTKNEFFKHCREHHGNTGVFEFRASDGRHYDYWNNVIDKEYQRQKNILTTHK